jgi:hypothetical protein
MPVITKYAATGQAAGGVFNGAWTNPQNVASDNAIYATAAPGKNQEFASVFPVAFSTGEVPAGATINSALVEIQVKCSTTSSIGVVTSSLFVDSAQATAIGATPGVQTPATEPTVDTTYSYTRNPTEAQIRDLWVRVQGTRGNNNTALTWSLDFVRVTVDYTDPPPSMTGTGSGTSASSSGTGTAAEAFRAAGAALSAASTGSGTGSAVSAGFSGSGAGTDSASTASGAGSLSYVATGSGSGTASTAAGVAVINFAAIGAGTDSASTSAGSGLLRFVSTGAAISAASSGSGSGIFGSGSAGSGAGTSSPSTGSGQGSIASINPEEGPWISHGTIHLARPPLNH